MQTLAKQLRSSVKRMREAHFSRERAGVIAEAIPLMERAADALETRKVVSVNAPIDPDLAKALAALGRGTLIPGRKYYINLSEEFDPAIDALMAKHHFEELVGR